MAKPDVTPYPKFIYVQDEMDVRGIIKKADEAGFKGVIARCGDCDQHWNKHLSQFDVGNYVDPSFADAVDEAHERGMFLFALYRVGLVPNLHYWPNRPTPIECFQTNTIMHACKNKTYQGIILTFPTLMNTDTNMMSGLNDMLYVFNERKIKTPLVIGSTPTVWGRGNAFENTIGQKDFPHIVWNMSASDYKVPGLLPTSNRFMWSYGYAHGSTAIAWIGSEAGLIERFGKPEFYDDTAPIIDPPVEPPATDPSDPPVINPIETDGIENAINLLTEKVSGIDSTLKEQLQILKEQVKE